MQKNFKEYEKSFDLFEKKMNEKFENLRFSSISTESINFNKEVEKKLEDQFLTMKTLIENERNERNIAMENFLTQNYQKEQMINNLTDGFVFF